MTARQCAGCGRPLRTSPGPYGPVCARRLTPTHPRARTTTPPTPGDGQQELPLAVQATLWSAR